MKDDYIMKKDICLTCGWGWYRKTPKKPNRCPKCHSLYQNKNEVKKYQHLKNYIIDVHSVIYGDTVFFCKTNSLDELKENEELQALVDKYPDDTSVNILKDVSPQKKKELEELYKEAQIEIVYINCRYN